MTAWQAAWSDVLEAVCMLYVLLQVLMRTCPSWSG